MANPFELVVQRMVDLGFYNFLFPFIITSALLFALLRKTKILGESIAINGVVALSVGFMIFGFPVLAGASLAGPLSTFFTQATVWILIGVVGMIMASFFYPDLMGFLGKVMTSRSIMSIMIVLGITLMITSGLVVVFTGGLTPSGGESKPGQTPTDVLVIIAGVMIFAVLILVASSLFGMRRSS